MQWADLIVHAGDDTECTPVVCPDTGLPVGTAVRGKGLTLGKGTGAACAVYAFIINGTIVLGFTGVVGPNTAFLNTVFALSACVGAGARLLEHQFAYAGLGITDPLYTAPVISAVGEANTHHRFLASGIPPTLVGAKPTLSTGCISVTFPHADASTAAAEANGASAAGIIVFAGRLAKAVGCWSHGHGFGGAFTRCALTVIVAGTSDFSILHAANTIHTGAIGRYHLAVTGACTSACATLTTGDAGAANAIP